MRTALVVGANGQDGSYLLELLLSRGYKVVGTVLPGTDNRLIEPLAGEVTIVEGDLRDEDGIVRIFRDHLPEEVYNLGARASSSDLFRDPVVTADVNAIGTTRLLEAIRNVAPSARFFQACSSEVFGNAAVSPQDENTPFHPRNPYGVAKAYAHWITVNYREAHGLFACSGILYNHESPRRGMEFVTRKITSGVAAIREGLSRELHVENLEARRDWGFAGDYVDAMWRMLQAPRAGDYIVATGESHSVREFCEAAFSHVKLDYRDYVVADGGTGSRPPETVPLVGNPGKARTELGWRPNVSFRELVRLMVDADLRMLRSGGSAR